MFGIICNNGGVNKEKRVWKGDDALTIIQIGIFWVVIFSYLFYSLVTRYSIIIKATKNMNKTLQEAEEIKLEYMKITVLDRNATKN